MTGSCNSTKFALPVIYAENLIVLSSVTSVIHAVDGFSITVSELALEKRTRATARSPAATLIAADPLRPVETQERLVSPTETLVQGRTRFPIRGEIRLFNTTDTDCYLKVASVPWGSPHSDATACRKCCHCGDLGCIDSRKLLSLSVKIEMRTRIFLITQTVI